MTKKIETKVRDEFKENYCDNLHQIINIVFQDMSCCKSEY